MKLSRHPAQDEQHWNSMNFGSSFCCLKSVSWVDPKPQGRLYKGCHAGRIAPFDYGFYRFHERIEVIEWLGLDMSLPFDGRDGLRIQNKRQVLFIGRFENCWKNFFFFRHTLRTLFPYWCARSKIFIGANKSNFPPPQIQLLMSLSSVHSWNFN